MAISASASARMNRSVLYLFPWYGCGRTESRSVRRGSFCLRFWSRLSLLRLDMTDLLVASVVSGGERGAAMMIQMAAPGQEKVRRKAEMMRTAYHGPQRASGWALDS